MKSLCVSLKDFVDARNDISDGSEFKTLTAGEWDEVKSFALKIMQVVQLELYESLKDQTKMLDHVSGGHDFAI